MSANGVFSVFVPLRTNVVVDKDYREKTVLKSVRVIVRFPLSECAVLPVDENIGGRKLVRT